jgi:hypothetical protein
MVKCGVVFEVRTIFLNITKTSFGFKGFLYNRVQYLSLLLLAGVEQSVPSTAAIF